MVLWACYNWMSMSFLTPKKFLTIISFFRFQWLLFFSCPSGIPWCGKMAAHSQQVAVLHGCCSAVSVLFFSHSPFFPLTENSHLPESWKCGLFLLFLYPWAAQVSIYILSSHLEFSKLDDLNTIQSHQTLWETKLYLNGLIKNWI